MKINPTHFGVENWQNQLMHISGFTKVVPLTDNSYGDAPSSSVTSVHITTSCFFFFFKLNVSKRFLSHLCVVTPFNPPNTVAQVEKNLIVLHD